MRIRNLFACAVLLCLTAFPALAGESIVIEVNKGQMVRLERAAASVMVADPSIADIQVVGPKMVYVHAKRIGETSIYAIDKGDKTILDATVEVTHNLSKLKRSIARMIPGADVELHTVDGGLVVNGYVDSPQESEEIRNLASSFLGEKDKLVNMVSTAGSDQVALMVKVAEVSRNELKRFGINLAAVLSSGNFAFQVLQGRSFLSSGSVTRLANDNSLSANWTAGGTTINSVIDALETQGLVSVLAEPSLTTASGKTANFLAGGEFPIPIVDGEGKVNVQYKPYGISLNFTPVVVNKDKISLTVAPEVSNISSVNSLSLGTTTQFVIPSLQTRRAETTVELGSGQTFAIAGLLKNDRSNTINKFPGLGDMPVLGALFRSQQFQNDQSELVILVTPYVVRPVSQRNMQTPIDGYTPPNDLERLLLGKLYREHAEGENMSEIPRDAPKLHGAGGFMMEQ
jgi:pilus assembly protein CpaC